MEATSDYFNQTNQECNIATDFHDRVFEVRREGEQPQQCNYVTGSDPYETIEYADATARCQAAGGELPYFDSAEEQCALNAYATSLLRGLNAETNLTRSQQEIAAKQQLRYWLQKFQYLTDEQEDRVAISWARTNHSDHLVADYPQQLCDGVPLNGVTDQLPAASFNSSDLLSFVTGDSSNAGCWDRLATGSRALVFCKICQPLVDDGEIVALTESDEMDAANDIRSYCNGAAGEKLQPNSLIDDQFMSLANDSHLFYDNFMPGCRYYALLGRKLKYEDADDACAKLNSSIVWFDSPREECLLFTRIVPEIESHFWIYNPTWGKYKKSEKLVLMGPEANSSYVARMCARRMNPNYQRLIFNIDHNCWEYERGDIQNEYVVCKRCGLQPLTRNIYHYVKNRYYDN